jgi:uncharacterized repeat protein (TIGR01451 family)
MKMKHVLGTGQHRVIRSILSFGLLLALLVGGLVGPAAMASPTSAAAPPSQIQTVTLEVEEQSDFSPDGYASYGEEITYILRYTISTGETMTGVTLVDDYTQQPPPNETFLSVEFLSSEGPFEFGNAPPVSPVTPVVDDTIAGRPVITWSLADISNSSGGDYIYEIHYHVRVYYDTNNTYRRTAHSESTLSWNEGGPATSEFNVVLLQPVNYSLNKDHDLLPGRPNDEVFPGDPITWTITMQNTPGNGRDGTAYDIDVLDVMPEETAYDDYFGPYVPTQTGNLVEWFIPEQTVGITGEIVLGINATLPLTGNVAHAPLDNQVGITRTSCPGNCDGERDYSTDDTDTVYVRNIDVGKHQSSALYHNNSQFQATVGEIITVSVSFTVPQGVVVYNPWLRVLLGDGLDYLSMIDPADPPNEGADLDPWAPNGRWSQLHWELPTIDNTDNQAVAVTYRFTVMPTQRYFIDPATGEEIPHNTNLQIVPIVRWADTPGGQPNPNDQDLRQRNTETNDPWEVVKFIRPDLRYQNASSGSYFTHDFSAGGFGGNANVIFTLNLRNRQGNIDYPTAYEVAFSDTLSPNLTYVAASPTPDFEESIPGIGYVLYWTLTTPISDNVETYVITATLPPTMVAGAAVTSTATAKYSTFPGDIPDEGDYHDVQSTNPNYTAQDVIVGGFEAVKSVDPADATRIGDEVDYSIVLTLNPGLIMFGPYFADTLPVGFHYVPDSMVVTGASLVGSPIYTPTTGARQLLSWELTDIDNTGGASPMVVTIEYKATMTGFDTDGFEVWASSRGDIIDRKQADNSVLTCWLGGLEPGAPSYCMESNPSARTYVVQPYLANNFEKTRTDMPQTEFEVGEEVHFKVDIYNDGWGPGYEVVISDFLPQGIAIQESYLSGSPPENLIAEPDIGATGVVSWTLGEIAPDQTISLNYDTLVLPSAIPGIPLTNIAHIDDYSSQQGTTNPYDRHYDKYDGAFADDPIPDAVSGEAFTILGLTVNKTDEPYDPTEPGAVLTYTVKFGNTSQLYGATDARITDTYDADVTYLGANFDFPIYAIGHDPAARTLVWGVDNVPTGGEIDDYEIEVIVLVDQPLDPMDNLLNNEIAIDGQGDMTGEVVRLEVTTIRMPFLLVTKQGSPGIVEPGEEINYSIYYHNLDNVTGTYPLTATNVWVQDIYDSNVTFVSANPPPYTGTSDQWFIGDLAPGGSGSISVTVQVNKPVPADADMIYNDIEMSADEVFPVAGETVSTMLRVPLLMPSITDTPDPVAPGGQIAYTINYINQGGVTANDVVLIDIFDPYADTVVGTPTPPPTYCVDNTCVWELGNLAAGDSGVITLVVQTDDPPPSTCQIINTVTLESDEVGPRPITAGTSVDPCETRIYLPLVTKGY